MNEKSALTEDTQDTKVCSSAGTNTSSNASASVGASNPKGAIEKIFGGINMSWPLVITFAIVTAILASVFLILPVFKNTSFERMGVYVEAWIFFAVIIMSNCKKPLESALKVFVFFLVSQPLIYLIQVPFNSFGWGVFRFYSHWFIITLCTFPAAFVGWYITKKNWLSALILSPVLLHLGVETYNAATFTLAHFPRLLITFLFCLLQIIIYVYRFFPDVKAKYLGYLIPLIGIVFVLLTTTKVQVDNTHFLPDNAVLTEEAYVVESGDEHLSVAVELTGSSSMVRVKADSYGEMDFTIRDGDKDYKYTLVVYEDDGGHTQIEINTR